VAALAAEAELLEVEWSTLPDTESPSPAENVEQSDLQASLRAALERLPANMALALRRYYLEDATLDDIAAELGVSRERARQVRDAGEKKLRADLIVLSLWQTLFAQS
jgi:RNA polymerase sigma factor for flagellar operon FliA